MKTLMLMIYKCKERNKLIIRLIARLREFIVIIKRFPYGLEVCKMLRGLVKCKREQQIQMIFLASLK